MAQQKFDASTVDETAAPVRTNRFRCECGSQHFHSTVLLAVTPAGAEADYVHQTEHRFVCIKCGQIWSPAGDGAWQKED